MKYFFILMLFILPLSSMSQGYILIGNNSVDQTTERYVQNSPGSSVGNRRVIEKIRDSTSIMISTLNYCLYQLRNSINNGFPTNVVWANDTGRLNKSPTSLIFDSLAVLYFPKPAGNATQYINGAGALVTLPIIPTTTTQIAEGTNLYYTTTRARSALSAGTGISYNSTTGVISAAKRQLAYLGTTDGSGNYTVTYSTAFSSVPDVQPQLQAGTPSQVVRITSSTTTGFTVQVTNRGSVTILSIEVLLAATTPVSGASVGVLVTER